MDSFWAKAGELGPTGLLAGLIILIMLGRLTPTGKIEKAHAAQITENNNNHAEQVAILNAQIEKMTTAHDKQVQVITDAHNLRVQQMTEAHNKATDERAAAHASQVALLNDMYTQQINWGFTDRNQWHDAYDDLSGALTEIAPTLRELNEGQKTSLALIQAVKRLGGDTDGH